MRLGSLIDGLAAAKQGQAEERPKLDFARAQRVSPLRTLIVEAALLLALRTEAEVASAAGRLSSAPARIWLGSTILGLTARSSGQRLPRPRFCCANFQSESPPFTLTVFCAAVETELGARCGRAGRTVATGAAGCAGSGGADGCTD